MSAQFPILFVGSVVRAAKAGAQRVLHAGQHGKDKNAEYRGAERQRVEPEPRRHADARDDPYAGGGGQLARVAAVEDRQPRADKADTDDYRTRQLERIDADKLRQLKSSQ